LLGLHDAHLSDGFSSSEPVPLQIGFFLVTSRVLQAILKRYCMFLPNLSLPIAARASIGPLSKNNPLSDVFCSRRSEKGKLAVALTANSPPPSKGMCFFLCLMKGEEWGFPGPQMILPGRETPSLFFPTVWVVHLLPATRLSWVRWPLCPSFLSSSAAGLVWLTVVSSGHRSSLRIAVSLSKTHKNGAPLAFGDRRQASPCDSTSPLAGKCPLFPFAEVNPPIDEDHFHDLILVTGSGVRDFPDSSDGFFISKTHPPPPSSNVCLETHPDLSPSPLFLFDFLDGKSKLFLSARFSFS